MISSIIAAAALIALCQAQFSTFVTRPGQKAVTVQVLKNATSPDVLAPGYIFITPYFSDFSTAFFPNGPQIFESDGTLVWDGSNIELRAMDAHVCDYLGGIGNHICYNDAMPIQQGGHSSGVIRFFDNTYTQVGTDFGAVNGLIGPDIHELNTPEGYEGQTFLQDVFETVEANLTAYGGNATGYVLSGCLQEVDMATKNVTFQWCSLDHIPVTDSYVNLNANNIAGNGNSTHPWDYIHMNSLDKDENGDYLLSGRHTDTLYKVAGLNHENPGSIIWRFGGKFNDFQNQGTLNFSRQHMTRWHGINGSVTTVSLFDNAFDGGNTPTSTTAKASSGMVVALDTEKWTATLMEQHVHPTRQLVVSQGALQFLPNGNRFLGWGNLPSFSEHDGQGNVLYYANFSAGQSFRASKSPWIGNPVTLPDVTGYALNCTSPLVIYASWNGATEVKSWNFYAGNSTNGTFSLLGNYPKNGYETSVELNSTFAPYVKAEAVDASGNVLKASLEMPTFVPNATLALKCTTMQCPTGTNYTIANSVAPACLLPPSSTTTAALASTSTTTTASVSSSAVVTSTTVPIVSTTATTLVTSSAVVAATALPLSSTAVAVFSSAMASPTQARIPVGGSGSVGKRSLPRRHCAKHAAE